jgi:hypothetical protein
MDVDTEKDEAYSVVNKTELKEIIQDMLADIDGQPIDKYAVLLTREKATDVIGLTVKPCPHE